MAQVPHTTWLIFVPRAMNIPAMGEFPAVSRAITVLCENAAHVEYVRMVVELAVPATRADMFAVANTHGCFIAHTDEDMAVKVRTYREHQDSFQEFTHGIMDTVYTRAKARNDNIGTNVCTLVCSV
jgi:hypothetical protein